jgi:hypothetical protein
MWFAYSIYSWAMDMFSMCPLRDYISGTEPNQERERERENENGASPR